MNLILRIDIIIHDWIAAWSSLQKSIIDNQIIIISSVLSERHTALSWTVLQDTKACRNSLGRPRRLLGEYETKEMVCPTCNRHFLGLLALQTHIGWSHCAPVLSSSSESNGIPTAQFLTLFNPNPTILSILSQASTICCALKALNPSQTKQTKIVVSLAMLCIIRASG